LRRALVFIGAGTFLVVLAFLVARPRVPDPVTNPYVGVRGGARSKAAGLNVRYLRDGVDRAIEPATVLRGGDILRFVVRGERPRHLEIRVRDAGQPIVTAFPPGAKETQVVRPGEGLPPTLTVAPGGGRLVVTALFSDHARQIGTPADPETETVTLAITKE
jgi:hypothetical protein